MGCQERGARKADLFSLGRVRSFKYICLYAQANLVRESENMVRDTAARLERAVGELGDLIVRPRYSFYVQYDPR